MVHRGRIYSRAVVSNWWYAVSENYVIYFKMIKKLVARGWGGGGGVTKYWTVVVENVQKWFVLSFELENTAIGLTRAESLGGKSLNISLCCLPGISTSCDSDDD